MLNNEETYKEILLKLSNPEIDKYENERFNPSNIINKKDTLKSFGITFSLPNCISYIIAKDKEILIKNINTVSIFKNIPNQNHVTFNSIYLTHFPIKNLTPIYVSDKQYILIIFTKIQVESYLINTEKNDISPKNILTSQFNKNILSSLIKVEFCKRTQNNKFKFVLACSNDKLYSIDLLPNYEYNQLIIDNVREIGYKSKGFFSYMKSTLLDSYFSNEKPTPKEDKKGYVEKSNNNENNAKINDIKYIGNDIISIVRDNYLFELINIKSGYYFYSKFLFDNINNKEYINNSKILVTEDIYFTNDDLKNTRRKIFLFFIYLNSHNINTLVSFRLMFIDIPENSLECPINDFKYYNSLIDIGTNVIFNNKQIQIIDGSIVDMIINRNKLWLLYIKNIQNNLNEKYFLKENYALKIYKLNEIENDIEKNLNENIFNNEILVDFNEKNLSYLYYKIDQINNNFDNIISKNKKIFTCLLNDEYFLSENIISFISKKYSIELNNKNSLYNFLKDKFLTNDDSPSIINEIILPLIQNELYLNNILCLGDFKNQDIDCITFIRQREVSFINTVNSFEKFNDYIKDIEFKILQLNYNESQIKDFIYSYLSTNDKNCLTEEENNFYTPLFIIFALLRVYLNENNLLFKNEDYILNVASNKNFSQYKDDIIKNCLNFNESSCGKIEFFLELINEIYCANKENIEKCISNIIDIFMNEYENLDNDDKYNNLVSELQNINEDINTVNINYKYCEIICKVILIKVNSLYSIANDIFCFKQWFDLYKDIILIEEPFNISDNKIDNFYIKNLILNLLCNHLTNFNTENISRINTFENKYMKGNLVTWIEKYVYSKFSNLGYDILNEQKNKFINCIICLILKDLFNNDQKSNIVNELLLNKDFKFLKIYNIIILKSKTNNNYNQRDLLSQLIICNAAENNINQMNNNLLLLYDKNNENNDTDYILNIAETYIKLRNYIINSNLFFEKNTLNHFSIMNYDLLINLLFNYILNDNIDIQTNVNSNDLLSITINTILNDVIENGFDINEDQSLVLFSNLENIIDNQINPTNYFLKNFFEKIKNSVLNKISIKCFASFIKSIKNSSKIAKFCYKNKNLISEICEIYEKELNDNENINKIENKINIYKFLNYCYLTLENYDKIIYISEKINKIIDIYLSIADVTLDELIYFYGRKIDTLTGAINAFTKKKQLNSFIKDDLTKLKNLKKEKAITTIKKEELNYYATTQNSNDNQLKELLKIKDDNESFIDYIFEFNNLNIAIQNDLIKYLGINEAKLFAFNLLNCLEWDESLKNSQNNKLLKNFMRSVYMDNERENEEYMFIVLEMLIRLKHSYLNSNEFGKILSTLEMKNKVRLNELLAHFS